MDAFMSMLLLLISYEQKNLTLQISVVVKTVWGLEQFELLINV